MECIWILWAAILSCYFHVFCHLDSQLTETQLGMNKGVFFPCMTYAKPTSVTEEQTLRLKEIWFAVCGHEWALEEELI